MFVGNMRGLRRFLLLCLFPLACYSQQLPNAQAQLYYQEAYRYILKSPELNELKPSCIAVFDSIVSLPQSNFSEQLKNHWGYVGTKKESQLLDSLFSLDESTYHKPYYSPITANLTTASGAEKGCLVIMFSRLSNNLLLAEVSDNQEGGSGRKSVISIFDQSILYLFIFGADKKIQKHYTQILSHN
ncbi:hypothetical protein DNI29_17465 [Hymenobacter sediminis]|uniref:hypothetical protein n=1 Tax=Hymenobacter sediminis TaxID=2218621 RepID=UPI000F502636|nr:hypothetical protein [Hymenobacter sediminis]RPD45932.1 hypothetical protein DNI29_17465 [Hymenobacter sediminis]